LKKKVSLTRKVIVLRTNGNGNLTYLSLLFFTVMCNVEAKEEISTGKKTSLVGNESTKHLNNSGSYF
jgi:hypothetical protein